MKKTTIVVIIIALVVIVGGILIGGYNKIVKLDQNVEGAWAQVETNYQRRADLIPNLVNTVKGAAGFEQKTLTDVIEARSRATAVTIDADNLTPESIAAYEAAQSQVSSTLGRLLAVAENYPQLTATQGFRDLQIQIEGAENRIATSRRDFNQSVQEYNTVTKSFPTVVYAKLFGFSEKGYFQSAQGTELAPTVDFSS
ncbi:MAG TPA: LemA family protein [Candidatus Paceibacterota bacterium]|nr:LemA family protein [Candidatus Paceibacterota bacterium]